MEQTRFDVLAQAFLNEGTRRRLLGALAGLGLGAVELTEVDAAKKNKMPKRKHFCLNGQTISARSKHKKRQLQRQGAVRGRCEGCTPVCPTNGCGKDDGCGNTCGCGAGTVCVAGVCETCTVICTGNAATCGATLQTTLDGGGDVYVCPGRYEATITFIISNATRIYGVGNGSDPATNTILATQNPTTGVLTNAASALTLSGLRITGGNNTTVGGGGIHNLTTSELLSIENCAIVGNAGIAVGGVYAAGPVAITNSVISGNTGIDGGIGGIGLNPPVPGVASTIRNTVIDGNHGVAYGGVYIATFSNGQSLVIDSTSRITNNKITALAGPRAGGIGHYGPGTADVTGTTISGNDTPQCENVTGCSS